jgi:hypothetical protein
MLTEASLENHQYVTAELAESSAKAAEQLAVLSRTLASSGAEATRLSQEVVRDAAAVQFASNVKTADLALWLIDTFVGVASITVALAALVLMVVLLRRRRMRR